MPTRATQILAVLLAALAPSLVSGCASVTSGPLKIVAIESDPPGATVRMPDGTTKETPCSLHFSGFHGDQTVSIEKPGYEPKQLVFKRKLMARTFWNVFFPFGFIWDFASGSAFRLYPSAVSVSLAKKSP